MREYKRIQTIFFFTALAFAIFAIGAFLMIRAEKKTWDKASDFMVSVSRQRTATYKTVNTLLSIPYGVVSPEQKAELTSSIRNGKSTLKRFYLETKAEGNPFFTSTLRVVESVYEHALSMLQQEEFKEQEIKKLLFLHKNALDQLDQLLIAELQKIGERDADLRVQHRILLVSSLSAILFLWYFVYRPFSSKYKKSQDLLEKQTEELLLKNKALLQTNRDLDRFAYVTSHDLKSPLRAINNLAEWIDEDKDSKLSEEAKRYFEILKNRVRRMERLINGILEYSRISRTDEPEEVVALTPIVDQIASTLRKSYHFDLQIEHLLPVLIAHPATIRRIFEHLIHNAILFNQSELPKIWIYAETIEEGVNVFIRDNGPGIEGRYHGKVFEIFQTLNNKDEVETTGIGLAVVKKAMEQMGGMVKLHTPQEGGTLVELSFPMSKLMGKKSMN